MDKLTKTFDRWFLAHPRSVNQSYFQHLWFAAKFGGKLLLTGMACIIHGLFPCLCTKTASNRLPKLQEEIQKQVSGERLPS